jgi:hypothetical protein
MAHQSGRQRDRIRAKGALRSPHEFAVAEHGAERHIVARVEGVCLDEAVLPPADLNPSFKLPFSNELPEPEKETRLTKVYLAPCLSHK